MFKLLDKKPKTYSVLLMIFMGAVPLVGAYVSEYGFGFMPCPLCIYQRIPYALIVIAGILMLLLGSRNSLPRFLFLCVVLFFTDAAIAGFHAGVEQHWWEGLEGCKDDIVAGTIDELRSKLMGTPIARCDEPAFMFLGLSMAFWNFLYATGSFIFTIMLLGRYMRD